MSPPGSVPTPTLDAGLCGCCLHARQVRSDRGSVFLLCRRAADDGAYARYPGLPMKTCDGHEPAAEPVPAAEPRNESQNG